MKCKISCCIYICVDFLVFEICVIDASFEILKSDLIWQFDLFQSLQPLPIPPFPPIPPIPRNSFHSPNPSQSIHSLATPRNPSIPIPSHPSHLFPSPPNASQSQSQPYPPFFLPSLDLHINKTLSHYLITHFHSLRFRETQESMSATTTIQELRSVTTADFEYKILSHPLTHRKSQKFTKIQKHMPICMYATTSIQKLRPATTADLLAKLFLTHSFSLTYQESNTCNNTNSRA